MARVEVRERDERSREMMVGFAEVDEEMSIEAFEEVEAEYAVEELNEIEGVPARGSFEYAPGPVIVMVVE